jgi:hypothetical protein
VIVRMAGVVMGRETARRILVIGGVCLACAACPPGQTSELRFLQFGQVLNSESTAGANTYEAVELAPVPDTSLPLFVDMRAPSANVGFVDNQNVLRGPQVEAHLFAVDLFGVGALPTDSFPPPGPDGVNDYFRTTHAAGPVSVWDARTNLSTLPLDVIMPFPPTITWDVQVRSPHFLLPVDFWPMAVPDLPPSKPDPPGRGSVKSARIYLPGLCSFDVPYTNGGGTGLYDVLATGITSKINTGGLGTVYLRATPLLDSGLGPNTGPRGGFFLYFWFHGSQFNPFMLHDVNIDFAGNYEYALGLDDGRLAVQATRNDLVVAPQFKFNDFDQIASVQIAQGLRDKAVEIQHQSFGPCLGGMDPTATTRTITGGIAHDGAIDLGLSNADATRVQNAVTQISNWECFTPSGGTSTVGFILRAKRINIYPDALELVWFDTEDPDDPMFGLYCAAVQLKKMGPVTSDPILQLCPHAPTFITPGTVSTRKFVTVSR